MKVCQKCGKLQKSKNCKKRAENCNIFFLKSAGNCKDCKNQNCQKMREISKSQNISKKKRGKLQESKFVKKKKMWEIQFSRFF